MHPVSNFQSFPLSLDNFSIHEVSIFVLFVCLQCHVQHMLTQLAPRMQRAKGLLTTLLAAIFVRFEYAPSSPSFLFLVQLSQG